MEWLKRFILLQNSKLLEWLKRFFLLQNCKLMEWLKRFVLLHDYKLMDWLKIFSLLHDCKILEWFKRSTLLKNCNFWLISYCFHFLGSLSIVILYCWEVCLLIDGKLTMLVKLASCGLCILKTWYLWPMTHKYFLGGIVKLIFVAYVL